jgi:hypothetical protein
LLGLSFGSSSSIIAFFTTACVMKMLP